MSINLPENPRILVTRLSAIGDCVHTVPMIRALRAKFPQAFIAWATQNAGATVVEGMDGLDEVVRIDRNWLKRPKTILATRKLLRGRRFDVVLDPQSLTKSSLLGWLSGASHRIGFAVGQGRELSPWLSTIRVKPVADHVVDRYLELLTPLDISNPAVRFPLPHRAKAAQAVANFLASQNVTDRFALLNPGAGWNSKLWPHDRYAHVAKFLYEEHRIKCVVLWAGDREKRWADAIVCSSQTAAVLAPETSLQELTEFCRAATLFVGSDTGPLHLAAAVGTSTVAMYGPTKISVCGPYAVERPDSNCLVAHEPLQVRFQDGTSRERRGDDNSAMQEISIESVNAACQRLLATQLNSKVA